MNGRLGDPTPPIWLRDSQEQPKFGADMGIEDLGWSPYNYVEDGTFTNFVERINTFYDVLPSRRTGTTLH